MKTIALTGSNSGIGKEASLLLAKEGHRLLMLSRDSEKSRSAHREIVAESGNQDVFLFPVDLANFTSIRAAAAGIKERLAAIDVLVNNAAVFKANRAENENGIEMTLAVNFLAPFLLSHLLLDQIAAAENGRIVNVVSDMYRSARIDPDNLMLQDGYKASSAYANSKLACVLFTLELAKRTADRGITVNALHPGVLATDVFRDYPAIIGKLISLFLENPRKGGERIAYLATSDEVKNTTGRYFFKTEIREVKLPPQADELNQKLWQTAQDLTQMRKG